MRNYVLKDYVIFEEFCNLRCDYCGGYYNHLARYKINGEEIEILEEDYPKIKGPIKRVESKRNMLEKIKRIDKKLSKEVYSPMIKLSGGEIFLFDEIYPLIGYFAEKYETVQVLSNGILIDPKRLKKIRGRINVQISLDGHSLKMNCARIKSTSLQKRILKNLHSLSEEGFFIEINAVLTKYNTSNFESFLKYLKKIKNIRVYPRPVRGMPSRNLKPSSSDIKKFKSINFNNYSEILPSKNYISNLIQILEGERINRCLVPWGVIGINYNGSINFCTCSEQLPKLKKPKRKQFISLLHSPLYSYIKSEVPNFCRGCTNQYDELNYYFNGLITLEDFVKTNPLYSGKKTIEVLKEIRMKINENK